MKAYDNISRTIERSNIGTTYQFGMKSAGLSYIFTILRDTLYSDKILALIREGCTNGVDSHVAAGIPEKPIDVYLPSVLNNTYRVRDYGIGLCESDIENVYCMYAESTKRDSNDFTGQLGLGAKSPFAYSSNFSVITYSDRALIQKHLNFKLSEMNQVQKSIDLYGNSVVFPVDEALQELLSRRLTISDSIAHTESLLVEMADNCVRTVYEAFIDESMIGQISKVGESIVSEPRGVEIVVPTRSEDIEEFAEKAARLFVHFDVRPTVHNSSKAISLMEEFDSTRVFMEGKNWKIRQSVDSFCIMGNVAYPIDGHILGYKDEDSLIRSIASGGVFLYFAIGELTVAASREALDLKPQTVKAIKTRLDQLVEEVRQQIAEKGKSFKSLWEARCYFNENINSRVCLYPIYFEEQKYKDLPIDVILRSDTLNRIKETYEVKIHECQYLDTSSKFTYSAVSVIAPRSNIQIVFRGAVSKRAKNAHMRGVFKTHSELFNRGQVLLIESSSGEALSDSVITEIQNDVDLAGANFSNLSSYESIPLETDSKKKSGSARGNIYSYDFSGSGLAWSLVKSSDVDMSEKQVYVRFFGSSPLSKDLCIPYETPSSIGDITRRFKSVGIEPPSRLYGIKQNGDIPTGWQTLKDYYIECLKDCIRKDSLVNLYRECKGLTYADEFYAELFVLIPEIRKDISLYHYLTALNTVVSNPKVQKTKVLVGLSICMDLVFPDHPGNEDSEVAGLRELVEVDYPFVKMMRKFVGPVEALNKEYKQHLLDYVNHNLA